MEAGPTASEYASAQAHDARWQNEYLWDELRKYKRRLKQLEKRVARLEEKNGD